MYKKNKTNIYIYINMYRYSIRESENIVTAVVARAINIVAAAAVV